MHLCGRRKYHTGRKKDALWVFGLTSRLHKIHFYIPVPCRSREVLHFIIEYMISKSIKRICSDGWRAYQTLDTLGYDHKTVIHSH